MPTEPHPNSAAAGLDQAMVRAIDGDQEAFGIVVEALQWPLRCWLSVRCPPGIDPDEIAHVAFVDAFHWRERYQPGSDVRAWIWGIARNKLLTELATRRRAHERHAELDPEILIDQLVDSTDDEGEEVVALRRCLSGLPPASRALLSRHYHLGQPLAEIAAAVGRSLVAIKKALFVLRRRLHDCMQSRLKEDLR